MKLKKEVFGIHCGLIVKQHAEICLNEMPAQNDLEPMNEFVETSKNIMCITGSDGYYKKVSRSFADLLGYEEDELLLIPVKDLIANDKNGGLGQNVTNISDKKDLNFYFENSYRCKNGTIKKLRWRLIPEFIPDGILSIAWVISGSQQPELSIFIDV